MVETAFSSIKRIFAGEHIMATRFQTGKRDDVEGSCATYLEEWYKENGKWLMRTNYATEQ